MLMTPIRPKTMASPSAISNRMEPRLKPRNKVSIVAVQLR